MVLPGHCCASAGADGIAARQDNATSARNLNFNRLGIMAFTLKSGHE
jgi:hypothetical protein